MGYSFDLEIEYFENWVGIYSVDVIFCSFILKEDI